MGRKPRSVGVPSRVVGIESHPIILGLWQSISKLAIDAACMKEWHDWEQQHNGRPHPRIGGKLSAWGPFTYKGGILGNQYRTEAVRVTLGTYERAFVVLNAVCPAAERAGFELRLHARSESIDLHRGDVDVQLRIVERFNRSTRHRIVWPGGERRFERYMEPTGALEIVVSSFMCNASIVKLKSDVELVEHIGKTIRVIERHHQKSHEEKNKWEVRSRELEQERLDREAAEQQRQLEIQRREKLVRDAATWAAAEQIRAYVGEMSQRVTSSEGAPDDFDDWRAWALRVADDMDQEASRVPRRIE